jgi:dTDP-6-deoxy-L-talose 4-dehydrogenase (NAD+)
MSRLLITGGTGFVGRQVIYEAEGYASIICLLRNYEVVEPFPVVNKASIPIKFVECGNLLNYDLNLISSYLDHTTDIIHCAWNVTPGVYHKCSSNIDWLNFTLKFVEFSSGFQVNKIIGLGTCSEYEVTNHPMGEHSQIAPTTIYAMSKAITGQLAAQICKENNVNFTWARLFYLYGANEPRGRLFSEVKSALVTGKKLELTDCSQIRDFLDVNDAAKKILKCARLCDKEFANICSGRARSIKQVLYDVFGTELNSSALEFGSRERNPFDPPYVVGIPSV